MTTVIIVVTPLTGIVEAVVPAPVEIVAAIGSATVAVVLSVLGNVVA